MPNEIDQKSLQRAMRLAPEKLFQGLKKEFSRTMLQFQRFHTLRRFKSQYSPGGGTPPKQINSRTGNLRRSFTTSVVGSKVTNLQGVYSSDSVYAPPQEFGATIKPRRRKYLTIPLEANLTAAGVMRRPARAWSPTFFTPSRKKAGDLIMWHGKGPGARPIFLLTRGPITLEPRLGLREEWQNFRPEVVKNVNNAVQKVLDGLG